MFWLGKTSVFAWFCLLLRRGVTTFLLGLSVFALIGSLPGCSTDYYREAADSESYAIVKEKHEAALGREAGFSLEDYKGTPEPTSETMKLDLHDCLRLVLKHNRGFQAERENLYRAALSLTGARYKYAPRFLSALRASISGNKDRSEGSLEGTQGLDKAWKWGLSSAIRFSTTLLRSFTANPAKVADSSLVFSFTQPLLQGFGAKVAAEQLTQAERNVLYAVRSFERARRELAISTTRRYLQTLQQYDSLKNAKSNLKSTQRNFERLQHLAKWGRIPLFQLDQAETSVLSAEEGLESAEQRLADQLDSLKYWLGLPIEQKIELDTAGLAELTVPGIENLELTVAEAQELALNCRLDFANVRDSVEDSERAVVLAADNLRTKLDLSGTLTIPSDEMQPLDLEAERFTYNAAVDLDLPFDRKLERNSYRRALINLESAKRNLRGEEEAIRQSLASAFRGLNTAKVQYEIALASRKVAEKRVESTEALMEWGRVETRDLLDALNAELRAKNAVTAALINYRLAYLDFLLSMGVLEVGKDGVYKDLALGKKKGGDSEKGETNG